MSQNLLAFVCEFLSHSYDCSTFCNQYIRRWKDERDSGEMLRDDGKTSEALSSIFCLADLYSPNDDREEYELDERSLRLEVQRVLSGEELN
jgi:hypothetical protein